MVVHEVDAPSPGAALSQLSAELRKIHQKAGMPTYRDILNGWPPPGEMSGPSLTRLLKGQGVRFPRWKTVAGFVHVCRDTLAETGVDPDVEIGSIGSWHTYWKQLNDLHLGNADECPAVLDNEDAGAGRDVAGPNIHGQPISHVPRHASDGRLCSALDEILFKRWLGYRGTELLDWVEKRKALPTFELGILLTLRGQSEGSIFLERAASLDSRLTLNLTLNPPDKLYGRIPSDICHRVGTGYAYEGQADLAQQWHAYARSLNGIPMIGILSPPGRHAVPADVLDLQPVRHAPLDPNKVLQIDTAYHEVYDWTPEPKGDCEILPMPPPPAEETGTAEISVALQSSSQRK
ncbi:hypothetical protein GCM10022224_090420 [Nonomuraea antimicrobica]|uniref:Uncharacterized protein n=1 Tax=Nonomuraea antimicrobica TaxID=561173 RepID=A0ABP7DWG5_9ACTN